ncbi:MAG TPA: DUF1501 domain-containing protein [Verrucomicrobiales bacterium]|nr:DUF1501 domain-containing protein [Verrucomicrobiales bacterium]HIL24933.1 DUF1501 domain-containing protein [Verrucomicrobiota bacterium]
MMNGCLDYQMTRRRMLGLSSATMLGMPIAQMLARAGETQKAKAEHVILFWCGGGMSHIDTWDPKPGRPVAGEFSPINTSAEGVQISSIFPQLAKQMHHAALIRSIAGTNGAHGRASYQLQTSYNQSASLIHPGIGSIVAHEKDRLGDLPSFITISGNARRAGYLGQRCEAYFVGRPGEKDPYLAFPAGITQLRGNKRLDILARMNLRNARGLDADKAKAVDTATREAVNLMRSPALKAFELKGENPKTVARYGDTPFGRGALLARRLVETGVRFVQVNRGGFDTHNNNFPAMQNHGDVMDPALASLISDLAASGKLAKTLVLVLSEFGRTPRINTNAGRDHHARCFSCFIAGGGIRGGQVIGKSDEDAMLPAERPVNPHDLHASLCHALGIDAAKEVKTPLGRPMRLINEGAKPVMELFG